MTHTKDEALKLALEKVANALPAYIEDTPAREYLAVIHSALAAPVQEPVAWEQFYPDIGKPQIAYLPPTPSPDNACYTTPPAAQPAVPDAFGTREGEHPQYIQGWNDCRAEMLKGMKT